MSASRASGLGGTAPVDGGPDPASANDLSDAAAFAAGAADAVRAGGPPPRTPRIPMTTGLLLLMPADAVLEITDEPATPIDQDLPLAAHPAHPQPVIRMAASELADALIPLLDPPPVPAAQRRGVLGHFADMLQWGRELLNDEPELQLNERQTVMAAFLEVALMAYGAPPIGLIPDAPVGPFRSALVNSANPLAKTYGERLTSMVETARSDGGMPSETLVEFLEDMREAARIGQISDHDFQVVADEAQKLVTQRALSLIAPE